MLGASLILPNAALADCSTNADCGSGQYCYGDGTCQASGYGGGGGGNYGGGGGGGGGALINPLQGGDLWSLLDGILRVVVRIGTIVVILMMVYVGFKFVTAKGEPGAITKARDMLLWTVVGALILLGAQAIATGIRLTTQALSVGG